MSLLTFEFDRRVRRRVFFYFFLMASKDMFNLPKSSSIDQTMPSQSSCPLSMHVLVGKSMAVY